jgi:hypothetical protein
MKVASRYASVFLAVGLILSLPFVNVSHARSSRGQVPGSGPRALPGTWADLGIGNVVYTVTDVGAHGWFDPANGIVMGSGFRFGGGVRALYHAGLIIAADATHVEDACYGSDDNGATRPFNFNPGCPVQVSSAPAIDQFAFAGFTDGSPDTSPLDLTVRQWAYAWANPPNNDFIILEFQITSPNRDQSFYVGWYADWDLGDALHNSVGYDASRWLGYTRDEAGLEPNYYGIAVLSRPPSGFRAVYNPTWVYPNGEYIGDPGFEDADKFDFLTGFDVTSSDVNQDWSMEIGVGPLNLQAGRSVTVAFLMVAGTSLADLQANTDAARAQLPICRPAVSCP